MTKCGNYRKRGKSITGQEKTPPAGTFIAVGLSVVTMPTSKNLLADVQVMRGQFLGDHV